MTDTKVRKKVREQKVNKLLGPWKVEDGRSDLKLNLRVVTSSNRSRQAILWGAHSTTLLGSWFLG